MKKKKKGRGNTISVEDYIQINRSFSRLEELEQNGWRWKAKDRPHKNKKKYNRKRDRKTFNVDSVSFFWQRYDKLPTS